MCGGFIGKMLSNPIVDVIGLGAAAMFAPELMGAIGGVGEGGAAADAGAAAAGAYGPGIAVNVGADLGAAGVVDGGAAAAGTLAGAQGGFYGPGVASNVEAGLPGIGAGAGAAGSSTPSASSAGWLTKAFPDFAAQHPTIAAAFGGAKGGLGVAQTISALYGLEQSQRLQRMTAPPNPANLTKMPGYQAGLEAVQRSMAAQGYQGSGNMMAALQKYGGDAYQQMWQGGIASGQAGMGGLSGQLSSLGLLTAGAGNLFGW